jgi:DNA-binding response OmpR family regulator
MLQQVEITDTRPKIASAALIVDDQRPLAELLAERLAQEGIEATVTATAAEGLAVSVRRTFDIAFVDLKLPDMNGIAVAAQLKQKLPSLRVILVTGFAASVDDAEPNWTPVDAVLPKPWKPAELEAILRTLGGKQR